MTEEKKEDKKDEKAPKENPKQPNIYEVLDRQVKIAEKQQKQIEALSEAILHVSAKVDAGGGGKSEGGAFAKVLETILGGDKKDSLKDIAKTAEGLVRVSEAMDRFRNPPRYSASDIFLMRAGARSSRYMTKAELKKWEEELIFGGEEQGHVRE